MGDNTFQIGSGTTAAFPVTIRTAMVSPIALPIPRMIAAVIPERAAGMITLLIVCQPVAPIASEPSLNSRGTELIASSETLTIVGSAIIPRRIDPASQVSPVGTSKETRIQLVSTTSPKKPYTTEGMPASSSTAGLIMVRRRGPASSEMKMALAIPSGTARTMAPIITRIVPTISERIP